MANTKTALAVILTIVIIIVVLVIAGLIYWFKFRTKNKPQRATSRSTLESPPISFYSIPQVKPAQAQQNSFLYGKVDDVSKDKIQLTLYNSDLEEHKAELHKTGKFIFDGKTKYYRRTIGYDKEVEFLQNIEHKDEGLRFLITMKLIQYYLESKKITPSILNDIIIYSYTLFKDYSEPPGEESSFNLESYLSSFTSIYLTKAELLLDQLDDSEIANKCKDIYNDEYGLFNSLVLNYKSKTKVVKPIISNNLDVIEEPLVEQDNSIEIDIM